MATLRSPEGCPWDKQQTHQSLLPYLVEESHEYIDAAQANDKAHMAEELGDVLFQVVFHSQVAKENGGHRTFLAMRRLMIRKALYANGNASRHKKKTI